MDTTLLICEQDDDMTTDTIPESSSPLVTIESHVREKMGSRFTRTTGKKFLTSFHKGFDANLEEWALL